MSALGLIAGYAHEDGGDACSSCLPTPECVAVGDPYRAAPDRLFGVENNDAQTLDLVPLENSVADRRLNEAGTASALDSTPVPSCSSLFAASIRAS